MPRRIRLESSLSTYHVVMRGNDKQDIFFDDQDRQRYINVLREYNEEYQFDYRAYCLMDNHVHLVLRAKLEELSDYIKRTNISFVYWYNKKYDRCGHLFQDRFKSEAIFSERHLKNAVRYVHNNPFNAGIISNITNYKWSSLGDYIDNTGLTDVEAVLKFFEGSSPLKDFLYFHGEPNEDVFLDYEGNPRFMSDEIAFKKITTCFGENFLSDLKASPRDERNAIIRHLCDEGYSVSQLARITRYSRGLINLIKNVQ